MLVDSTIIQHKTDEKSIWFFLSYDLVKQVLKNENGYYTRDFKAISGAPKSNTVTLPSYFENHLLNKDGEDHLRLRRLVSKAYSAREVSSYESWINETALNILNEHAATNQRKLEVVNDYAIPLTIMTLSKILGIPIEDSSHIKKWVNIAISPVREPKDLLHFIQQMTLFLGYLNKIVEQKTISPQSDLISELIKVENEGDKLSKDELFSMILILLISGYETTAALISSGVYTLLTNQKDLKNKDQDFWKLAIREIARFDSPVEQMLVRWVTEDIEIENNKLKRGDEVVLVLGSASRDEKKYSKPDEFKVEARREYLSFGYGAHFCLGIHLAALESRVALSTLFNEYPNVSLITQDEERAWGGNNVFRFLKKLEISLD